MKHIFFAGLCLMPFMFSQTSCKTDEISKAGTLQLPERTVRHHRWADSTRTFIINQSIREAEQVFIDSGLVDIQSLDSTIRVDLVYSGTLNIAGQDLYGDICHAYLQPDVAEMLARAQQILQDTMPGYSLLVFDAARPLHVQQIIWDSTSMPLNLKTKYLSNPRNHSIHNYGAAVDLTLVDTAGRELNMGTPFDFFGPEAQPIREQEMLKLGKLTPAQVENRDLLRHVMKKAGFREFPYEWWHFNACSRTRAKQKYKYIP